MNNRTKAALVGGLIAGVLSGIPIVGACCFLWAVLGGFLAVWMYLRGTAPPLPVGDGAKIGAIAGVIGAVVSTVLGIPFLLLNIGGAAMSNPDLERAGLGAGFAAAAGVGGLILRAVIVIGCAVLGGVIGAAVFGKGPGTAPPPPPAGGGFGGPGAGGPGAGGGFGNQPGGGGGFGGPSGGSSYGQGS